MELTVSDFSNVNVNYTEMAGLKTKPGKVLVVEGDGLIEDKVQEEFLDAYPTWEEDDFMFSIFNDSIKAFINNPLSFDSHKGWQPVIKWDKHTNGYDFVAKKYINKCTSEEIHFDSTINAVTLKLMTQSYMQIIRAEYNRNTDGEIIIKPGTIKEFLMNRG